MVALDTPYSAVILLHVRPSLASEIGFVPVLFLFSLYRWQMHNGDTVDDGCAGSEADGEGNENF